MLPMLRYSGHAFLSPLRTVKCVLSDPRITGMTVDSGGSDSYKFIKIVSGRFHQIYLSSPPVIRCGHLRETTLVPWLSTCGNMRCCFLCSCFSCCRLLRCCLFCRRLLYCCRSVLITRQVI